MGSELTQEDIQSILKIIDDAGDVEELEIVFGDVHLHLRKHDVPAGSSTPVVGGAMAAPAARTPGEPRATGVPDTKATVTSALERKTVRDVPTGLVAIRSPMVGTFYRSPSPGESPFVEVGHDVSEDDTVCLIEVMKLFNSITAGVSGRITEIWAENGGLVEHDEVLMLIAPRSP